MTVGELLPYLPPTNAALNSLSAMFLFAGYRLIKRKQIETHRKCMIAAFATSTLFLISYLTYHFNVERTVFANPAWFRPIYLAILLSHTLLAAFVLPLALISLILGLKRNDPVHRRISRWTWPIWMYVSVTGVLIYFLLYQVFPQRRAAAYSEEASSCRSASRTSAAFS